MPHTFLFSVIFPQLCVHAHVKNLKCLIADRNSPSACRSLRSQKIKYLSCGADHTAALTLVQIISHGNSCKVDFCTAVSPQLGRAPQALQVQEQICVLKYLEYGIV